MHASYLILKPGFPLSKEDCLCARVMVTASVLGIMEAVLRLLRESSLVPPWYKAIHAN